jgi:hypothetical protein
LLQGLAVDLLVAAGAAGLITLGTMSDDQLWTTAGLITLGTSIAKSALTALLSYAARMKLPPATAG